MKRTNSPADALNTGEANLDLGDGLSTRLPLGRPYIIDQSAGRVVKVWDYLNNREQLIYGDTGWRDVAATLGAAAGTGTTGGEMRLRRSGNLVELTVASALVSVAGTPLLLSLPAGYKPSVTLYEIASSYFDTTPNGVRVIVDGRVVVDSAAAGDTVRLHLTFTTVDPWPASLPGTAVGSTSA